MDFTLQGSIRGPLSKLRYELKPASTLDGLNSKLAII